MGDAMSTLVFTTTALGHKYFGDKRRVSSMVGLEAVQYSPLGLSPAAPIDTICELVANPPEYVFRDEVDPNETDEQTKKGGKLVTLKEYEQDVKPFSTGSNPFQDTDVSSSSQWRHIDGGNNNTEQTWMGQGGRGMALRFPKRPVVENPPDAAELVDAFCIRQPNDDAFTPCCNGVNSLVCYFALCVIHDFFRSDTGRSQIHDDERPWVNLHSSYLDLQTVYGYSKATAAAVRSQKDGKLKPGSIADHRLDRLAVCHAIILMFAEHHNYICDQLLEKYPDKFKDDDETTFQTARLINTGVYINVILELYSCGLFHVWREDGKLPVDVRGLKYPRDMTGYHLSYEFNIMYRFHAFIPKEWTPAYGLSEEVLNYIKQGDYVHSVKPLSDDRIKSLLLDAVFNHAGANHVPNNVTSYLRGGEIKGIEDSREMGICNYNDFRESVGLGRYESFLTMCGGKPEVAAKLAKYYDMVDDVEFYIGMRVETRDPLRGAGFTDTVGRAILADALSSIRFDRFYTKDYTAEKYTEWGLAHTKECHTRDLLLQHLDIHIDVPIGIPLCLVPDSEFMPEKFRIDKSTLIGEENV